jgi:hypothetical protein
LFSQRRPRAFGQVRNRPFAFRGRCGFLDIAARCRSLLCRRHGSSFVRRPSEFFAIVPPLLVNELQGQQSRRRQIETIMSKPRSSRT